MTDLRNRMDQDTLRYFMKTNKEGNEDSPIEYIEHFMNIYIACNQNKNCRLRFKYNFCVY